MWSQSLQRATISNQTFNCLAIDDDFENALVLHRYPYQEGADIENMGTGPRHISIQAFFWGDNYETQVETFITAITQAGPFAFIHPVFGFLPSVAVVRGSIHHDEDSVDQAVVSFEILSSIAGNPFFTERNRTGTQTAQAVNQQTQNARNVSSGFFANILNFLIYQNPLVQLTQLQNELMAPITQMQAIVSTVTSSMSVLQYPLTWASNLTSLTASVMNVVNFSPTSLLSSYKNAINQISNSLLTGNSYSTSGPQGVLNIVAGITPIGPQTPINATTPTQTDLMTAAQVHMQVELASSTADAAAAIFQSQVTSPTMSPESLQTIANISQAIFQNCIEIVRLTYPVEYAYQINDALRDAALAMNQAAIAAMNASPPLTTRSVTIACSVHWLAWLWYGDHTRAEQLQQLNSFSNPNFLTPGLQVTCYAQ